MIFFVYNTESEDSIGANLGLADYSYFFVMKKFIPVLEKLGQVIILNGVAGLDDRYQLFQARGKSAILLSFTPPHRTPMGLRCPTFPVFAWEYSTIPSEAWGNNAQQNWALVLASMAGAITHSYYAGDAVKLAVAPEYPVVSLPAPLWDEYAPLYPPPKPIIDGNSWCLDIGHGVVLDSHAHGLRQSHAVPTPSFTPRHERIQLQGIVYTSVFNPNDGRKNWWDVLTAFCLAFRDNPAVTLLVKLVHSDSDMACGKLWHEMKKLAPYQCRVVAVQGYLDSDCYRALVANSTYIVNSARGEGQCLPLMEFMSAGKPALAPDHTAMADYINRDNAFVVRSSAEWTHWPHDPRLAMRAFRYRINWESLRDAYLESYAIATMQPEKYLQMAEASTEALRRHCENAMITERLKNYLAGVGFHCAGPQWLNKLLARARHLIARWRG
jgi:glycosyltransferase involved in cell wall biosynthesis